MRLLSTVVFLAAAAIVSVVGQTPPAPKPPSAAAKPAPSGRAGAVPPQSVTKAAAACDAAAAHADDPQNVSHKGVADEAINPAATIERCAAAVQESPGSARLTFQLGRAYWAAKRYDEALDAFLAAEELGYAPAYFYLGLAQEQGLIEGEKPDLAAAAEMYMVAASEGFAPAIEAYQGIEWSVAEIDFKSLAQGEFAKAIYDGDFSFLEKLPAPQGKARREELLSYVWGVNAFLSLKPNTFDAACQGVAEAAISDELLQLFRVKLLGLPARQQSELDDAARLAARQMPPGINLMDRLAALGRIADRDEKLTLIVQAGTDDVYGLASDYGGCGGEAVGQFYKNIKQFVTAEFATLGPR